MSPIDAQGHDQYTITLSANRLLLTISSVLLLMVLSVMLGIRIERHQIDEGTQLQARAGILDGQPDGEGLRPSASPGPAPAMMPLAPAQAPTPAITAHTAPAPRPALAPAKIAKAPVKIAKAPAQTQTIRAEDLPDTVPPPTPLLLAKATAPRPIVAKRAPKPAATPIARRTTRPKTGAKAYVVQIASSRDRNMATTRARLLKRQGLAAFVESADLGTQGVWYRVLTGTYSSKSEATAVLARIQQDPRNGSSFVRSY